MEQEHSVFPEALAGSLLIGNNGIVRLPQGKPAPCGSGKVYLIQIETGSIYRQVNIVYYSFSTLDCGFSKFFETMIRRISSRQVDFLLPPLRKPINSFFALKASLTSISRVAY